MQSDNESITTAKDQPTRAEPGRATRRRLLRSAAGGLAVAGGAALAAGFGAGGARAQAAGVSGTWNAVFTRNNPPPGFMPVQFLFTFASGGDLLGAGPSILFENGVPGFLGPENGQWRQTGAGAFSLNFGTTSVGLDGSFNYYLNTRVDMTMAADGNSWSGTYTRHDIAADGTELRAAPGTITARPLAPPA